MGVRIRRFRWTWHRVALLGILVVSAFLNLYGMNREGYGNEYYAAAVKSMLMNWHNFFYNSFDPNGFITIDKPPVDFWLQALFAWVFGFHGWALLLPQAIAGVCSVAVLYHLVRRVFGVTAGLIAALVMALTPIAVAVQRTNEVDGVLVLVMLLATWCLQKAIETRRLRWLIGVGVLEGIGFNIKMMEAYLILPAIYLGYLLVTRLDWRKKLLHLATMTAVLAAVSFSWAVAVDMTPASQRPYVGSTQTNSEMELIFGYNGIARLTGNMSGARPGASGTGHWTFDRRNYANGSTSLPPSGGNWGETASQGGPPAGAVGGPGPASSGTSGISSGSSSGTSGSTGNGTSRGWAGFGGQRPGGPMGGRGGAFNTGTPGVLRLFQSQLSGQISWLLPIALISLVPLLRRVRWRRRLTGRERATLFWAAWVLPMAAFFSVAQFFHQYYLITMAPGIAALTGAGLVQMWRDFKAKNRWRWLLPVAVLADLAFECGIVLPYSSVRAPLIVGSVLLVALAAAFLWRTNALRMRRIAAALGVFALLLAPGYWALTPILNGVNTMLPAAGPQQTGMMRMGALPTGSRTGPQTGWAQAGAGEGAGWRDGGRAADGFGGSGPFTGSMGRGSGVDVALVSYLERHYKASPGAYLVATQNANTAAPIILDTGLPVMAMGGFAGSDPAVTVQQLANLTKSGKLKYFLIQSGGPGGGQSEITQWILKHCEQVPESAWAGSARSTASSSTSASQAGFSGRFNPGGGLQLYEYTGSK
jgi:4-amino-4-deoxy-L-arabinose transferase-like glycosyltransferase